MTSPDRSEWRKRESRVLAARTLALEDAGKAVAVWKSGHARTVWLAIGDPQAPLETFFKVLEAHGVLGDDGRLKRDVGLVSMGDHFDWGRPERRAEATREGPALLAWLAAHPLDQVTILFGNHDFARVGELAHFATDADFEAAHQEATAAYRKGEPDAQASAAFLAKYPFCCDAEILARDMSCFSVAQRDLVTALLSVGRVQLAAAHGSLLLVHAGVTPDDLAQIGATGLDAKLTAERLNAFLRERLEKWKGGVLDLSPLHVPGDAANGEGRGILYHRPADPIGEDPRRFDGPPRRRFDAGRLSRDLVQAIGHIRDNKCRTLLKRWSDGAAAEDGPLRSLSFRGQKLHYGAGVAADATMIFVDAGMSHADPERYQLLNLDTRQPSEKPAIKGT